MIDASIADRGGGYAEKSIGSQPGAIKLIHLIKLMHPALSNFAAHPQRLYPFQPACIFLVSARAKLRGFGSTADAQTRRWTLSSALWQAVQK